jgi:acetolactate synthase-1/2/3 large subunit
MISPDQYTAPRVTSIQRPDGTMISKPLEDMWLFLNLDEFMSNMLIPQVEE